VPGEGRARIVRRARRHEPGRRLERQTATHLSHQSGFRAPYRERAAGPPKSVTAPRLPVCGSLRSVRVAAQCVGAVRDAAQPPRWLSGALIPVAAHSPRAGT
jgi:hypothetical protein